MAKKVKDAYETEETSANEDVEVVSAESDEATEASEPDTETQPESANEVEFGDMNALIAELDRVSQELEEQRQKSNEMQARYLRAIADLENYRKRSLKEKDDLSKLVISNFVEDLLPVIDNFKLGMSAANASPEAKVVADGLGMVLTQFLEVLKNKGIEEVVPNGQEFDPQVHECVSHLPHNDVAENHVIETIRTGYKMKDRLIRAASVVVSSGKPQQG